MGDRHGHENRDQDEANAVDAADRGEGVLFIVDFYFLCRFLRGVGREGDFLYEVSGGVVGERVGEDCFEDQDEIDEGFPDRGEVVGYYLWGG